MRLQWCVFFVQVSATSICYSVVIAPRTRIVATLVVLKRLCDTYVLSTVYDYLFVIILQ